MLAHIKGIIYCFNQKIPIKVQLCDLLFKFPLQYRAKAQLCCVEIMILYFKMGAWAWFVCVGAWFAVTSRFCSARLFRLAMATTADKSTKERLLSALADLEVLSR